MADSVTANLWSVWTVNTLTTAQCLCVSLFLPNPLLLCSLWTRRYGTQLGCHVAQPLQWGLSRCAVCMLSICLFLHLLFSVCMLHVWICGVMRSNCSQQEYIWCHGVVRVVDDPAHSPFIWPCFAGLNEQAAELRWDEVLMCSWSANRPACQCIYLLLAFAELAVLWLGCWLIALLLGWGSHCQYSELTFTHKFMISSLQSVSLLSSLFPGMQSIRTCLQLYLALPRTQAEPSCVHRWRLVCKQTHDVQQQMFTLLLMLSSGWETHYAKQMKLKLNSEICERTGRVVFLSATPCNSHGDVFVRPEW